MANKVERPRVGIKRTGAENNKRRPGSPPEIALFTALGAMRTKPGLQLDLRIRIE